MAFWSWSKTASSNATADSTINWAEGQSPSSVNDSARAMMARTAEYRDDITGAIVTGGTSTAFTVTSNQGFDTLAHMANQMIAFTPNATSTNAVGVDVTLNVDSLGAKPIRMQPSVALPGGTLILGTPYIVVFNNSDAVFYLHNMTSPYTIPLAGGLDFWGSTTPNSSFAFPTGQAISRTTYATLFSLIGTQYGAGDASTTFNIPNKIERVSVMKASSASLLTSTYFGGDSTALGATGGGESKTLLTANLPAYTPSGSIGNGAISATVLGSPAFGGIAGIAAASPGAANVVQGAGAISFSQAGSTFTGSAQGGSSTAFRTVQPTIVCNYIMRII